jgi:hypothetical protein
VLNERQREIATKVLALLEEGKSLRGASKESGIDPSTVLRWTAADENFSQQYARARRIGYSLLAEEIVEIADDSTGDATVDEDGNVKQNNEFVNRARLRVDTRKWILAKMLPKVYGERVEHEHKGGITVQLTGPEARL